MDDLIKRLQEAEAGSRYLDWEIWSTIIQPWMEGSTWSASDATGEPECIIWSLPHSQKWFNDHMPFMTTSIDAIVALIGEKLPGWRWSVYQRARKFEGVLGVNFAGRSDQGPHRVVCKIAGHPALALSAALLTALQTNQERETDV